MPKLPSPQWLPYLEIIYSPSLMLELLLVCCIVLLFNLSSRNHPWHSHILIFFLKVLTHHPILLTINNLLIAAVLTLLLLHQHLLTLAQLSCHIKDFVLLVHSRFTGRFSTILLLLLFLWESTGIRWRLDSFLALGYLGLKLAFGIGVLVGTGKSCGEGKGWLGVGHGVSVGAGGRLL